MLGVRPPKWQELGLEAPKRRAVSFVSEVGVSKKSEEDQRSFGQVKALPQKRRAVIRVESAETQYYVSAPPLAGSIGVETGGGGRERYGGAQLVPECSERATLGLAQVEVQSIRLTSATNVTMKGD